MSKGKPKEKHPKQGQISGHSKANGKAPTLISIYLSAQTEDEKCKYTEKIYQADPLNFTKHISEQFSTMMVTPLNIAVTYRLQKLVELLIRYGININFQAPRAEGDTTAHFAASDNNVDTIFYLDIFKGFDINTPNYKGDTPLHSAVKKNSIDAVLALFTFATLDRNLQNKEGKTAYDLIESIADPNIKKNMLDIFDNKHRLKFSTVINKDRLINHFIEPSEINTPHENNRTVLHFAAQNGNAGALRLFCNQPGTNLEVVDILGNTPLHHCILHFKASEAQLYAACIKQLVIHNPNLLKLKNLDGKTAHDYILQIPKMHQRTLFNALFSMQKIVKSDVETDIRTPIKTSRSSSRSPKKSSNSERFDNLKELKLPPPKLSPGRKLSISGDELPPYKKAQRPSPRKTLDEAPSSNNIEPVTLKMIQNSDLTAFEDYLKLGDPNLKIDPENKPLIQHAFRCKKIHVFIELLKHNADIAAVDDNNNSIPKMLADYHLDADYQFLYEVEKEFSLEVNAIKQNYRDVIEEFSMILIKQLGERGIFHPILQQKIELSLGEFKSLAPENEKKADFLRNLYEFTFGKVLKFINSSGPSKSNMEILAEQEQVLQKFRNMVYGLLHHYNPDELITGLLQIIVYLGIPQQIVSHLLVKELLVLSYNFGFTISQNLLDAYYEEFFETPNKDIPDNIHLLKRIAEKMHELHNHTIYKQFIALRKLIGVFPFHDNQDIIATIQDFVEQDKNINEFSQSLAKELNALTVRYYQLSFLDHTETSFDKMIHLSNDKFNFDKMIQFSNGMINFFKNLILKQKDWKASSSIIKILILTGKACVEYPEGPNLFILQAIYAILGAPSVRRLYCAFNHLDKKTKKIYNDLKITAQKFTFQIQSNYLIFPNLLYLFQNKAHIIEAPPFLSLGKLGHLYYQPLLDLMDNHEFLFVESKSDLLFQSLEFIDEDETKSDLWYELSYKLEPAFQLTDNVENLYSHLEFITKYNLPLIINHKGIYEQTKCLQEIDKWSKKWITDGSHHHSVYYKCDNYITAWNGRPKKEEKPMQYSSIRDSFFRTSSSSSKGPLPKLDLDKIDLNELTDFSSKEEANKVRQTM